MKKGFHHIGTVLGIASLSLCIILLSGTMNSRQEMPAGSVQGDSILVKPALFNSEEIVSRQNIAFILGEDENDNLYYWNATQYYRRNTNLNVASVNTKCRSLQEVRDYLMQNNSVEGQAWGNIYLVVHSNEWSGMDIPLVPDGPRANAVSVDQALDAGYFPPFPKGIIDNKTEIHLQACALGRDLELLKGIREFFSAGQEREMKPIVRSSRYFQFYESKSVHLGEETIDNYMAEIWYAFYRRGYKPGDIRLAQQLGKRYPDITEDWRGALSRQEPRFPGDSYHYTFHLPVVWTVTYPDKQSRPDLDSPEAQTKWIDSQPELQEAIRRMGISQELFSWTFRKVNHTFEDGVTEPGIKAIGFCTVLCVLRAITKEDPGEPGKKEILIPDPGDERYFTSLK